MIEIRISHWLPIVTFCPVNGGMDWLYITLTYSLKTGQEQVKYFPELYQIRRDLRKVVQGREMFMEDVAELVLDCFAAASAVEVALMFGRHVVKLVRQ